MIAISILTINECIKYFEKEIEKYSNDAFNKLKLLADDKKIKNNAKALKFIKMLVKELENKNILTLGLDEMETLKTMVKKVPTITFSKKKDDTLQSKIINALGYHSKRGSFYPKYFGKIGIKACVYCNSQYTLSLEKSTFNESGKKQDTLHWVAKFQVDHFYSQIDYPYLSISLLNLYPTCATCNNIKQKKPVNFKLYSDSNTPNPNNYAFSITETSKAEYLIDFNHEKLAITFHDPDKISEESFSEGCLQDLFHIQEIYNTQKDIAAELINKSLIYNDVYKNSLFESFSSVVPHPKQFNRILIGNYDTPEDIHKRPMSKFIQDIAKGLHLI